MPPTTRSATRSARTSQLSLESASDITHVTASTTTRSGRSARSGRSMVSGEEPPLYTVDLSKPAKQRYADICCDFREEILELAGLYNGILELSPSPGVFGFLAKVLLNRVHSKEETQEIRGIAKVTGIPLHLIVAYNTFLDLFSGCISGGVRTRDTGGMVHFRGLDWEMDSLRDMIIRVQYMRNGKIVARAVTYAGYVGTLTGVREGLSISLNYRARLDSSNGVLSHRLHQLALLLGWRPSISSQLRQILLAPGPAPTLEELSHRFQTNIASPCYLTFCSPSSILIVEKDLESAVMQTSDDFLAVTNHDRGMEGWSHDQWQEILSRRGLADIGGVHNVMKDSIERKECIFNLWRSKAETRNGVSVKDVKRWLRRYPLRNECTHFSCIMDPSAAGGGLVWLETAEGFIPP